MYKCIIKILVTAVCEGNIYGQFTLEELELHKLA